MHRLLAIAVLLFSTAAAAQFGSQTIIIFPGVPSGSCSATQLGLNNANGNLYSCGPGSAWLLIGPSATAANPGGSANQIQFNSGGVSFGGFTMSQDCTIVVATGVITCTKTNNVAFAASATTDTTIATNISSGTLAGARMSAVNLAASGNGGVTGLLAVANGGTGTASPGLVQGSNITITGSWPNQTIAASGGTGTVTSIATTAPIAGGTITASGTISLQNSTPANITALTGTDTLVPTNSGAFTNGHSVVGDAQGGIADSGSANVTPTSTTTFTNKSIAGSEINSGLVASTVGGTGVNNSATLTLGSSNQNWATLGTGIVKNTTTTGALSDAASSDVIGLWTGSCSSSTYLNGAGACATPSGSGTVTGVTTAAPFTSQTISTSGTIAFPTTSVSGYPLVAVNGAQPAFSASTFKDSTNSPVSLASAAYVPACDSSTTTVDRGTNIVFITSNTQPINLPLSSASGCSGMYFRGQNLTGGNITINKNTTDTLTVTGGTGTQGTGQPSATITNNTYFSANQSSSGVWEITGLPSSSSAAFSALTAGTNTSAAMVVGSGSSLTPTGTGYINGTNGVQSTFGASGTTLCDRFNTQATAFSLEVITSEGEAGSIFNCADIDIDNPTNGWRLNGQTIIQTDEGFHLGNRETIDGYVGNVGSTAATSGTQFQTSAAFPLGTSGGAITTSGTNSSGSSSLKLAKGAVGILLSSYETLTISGDATVYYLKACTTGSGNCANSDTSISQYSLPASGTVTVGVVPNLASSPTSGTAVTFTAHPLIQFQDQNVTAANSSPSGVQIHNMFINCNANAGVGTGLLDVYAQENSEARNVYVTNCGRGFWIPSGANSGDWTNLNVGYTSSSDCPSPTIPFEVSGAHKRVSRVTITTQTCAAAKITTGIFHVTNAQLGGISSPGGITLDNVHGEAAGTATPAIDMILVDSVNPAPAGITGPVEISEPSGCPTNASDNACKNLVHVSSNFSGTLYLHDGSCNSGTINAIQDDINGNTMLCSNNTNGIGFYRILEDGTAETNLNCTDMTKGWCITGNIRAYYLAGVAQFKMNGPTLSLGSSGTLGSLTMGNATSGLLTVEPGTGAITSYTLQLPVAQPSGSNTFVSCTAANPSVCSFAAGGGGTTTNALTGNNSNSGAASGSTFNGSAAVTFSANTFGAASLANANTFSAANTFSVAGAASTPAVSLTGATYTGGSGTTTFPLFNLGNGAAVTTWSTSGTIKGIDAGSGFVGNLEDYHINGGASVYAVNYLGGETITQVAGTTTALTVVNSTAATSSTAQSSPYAPVQCGDFWNNPQFDTSSPPITAVTALDCWNHQIIPANGSNGISQYVITHNSPTGYPASYIGGSPASSYVFMPYGESYGLTTLTLAAPNTPVITHAGTGGSATWTYEVVACVGASCTAPSTTASCSAACNATLTSGNYNIITWTPTTGADYYEVYRTVSGGTPASIGGIGKVAYGATTTGASCSASTCVFYDQATTGDTTTAQAFNATGTVIVGTGTVIGCAAGSTCGGSIYGPGGSAPSGTVSTGAGIYFNSSDKVDIINGTTDVGAAAAVGATETFTAAQTFSGGIVNTTTPIRDETSFVLAANMTAVATAGVNIGSTGAGNSVFSWPVTAANWYDLRCELPTTFATTATIRFELVSISGSVTVSNVNAKTRGNTGASGVFQDLPTIAGTSLAGSETPVTGAPGASEDITYDAQFLTSHAGNIGLEFIANGTNNVTMLLGGECRITQIN